MNKQLHYRPLGLVKHSRVSQKQIQGNQLEWLFGVFINLCVFMPPLEWCPLCSYFDFMSYYYFPVPSLVVKHWSLAWTLCEALWGHLKETDSQLDEPNEYIQILERRRTFSRWLSYTAAPQIEEEVSLTRKDKPVEAVFSYLTGKRISEACSLAQQSGRAYGPSLHPCLCYSLSLPLNCRYAFVF